MCIKYAAVVTQIVRVGFDVKIADIVQRAHHLLEAREYRRITISEMAERIGVSSRAFTEYQRGTNEPLAMKAILNLLGSLEDEELIKIVRDWRKKQ